MLQLTTIFFLISFSVLAVLHYLALKLFLYWRIEWLDMLMHFFGGAVVALGVYTLKDIRIFRTKSIKISLVLLLVFLVAAIWELFELYIGYPIDGQYFADTTTDIMMGLVGGYIGYIVGNSLHNL